MKVLRRMLSMCELSWELLMRGLQLSCVLLFAAFLLLSGLFHFQKQGLGFYDCGFCLFLFSL